MRQRFILYFLLLLLCLLRQSMAQGQPDTAAVNNKRLLVLGSTFTVGYTSLLLSLNKAWYSQEDKTDFHWFNDNRQWKQMDKAGHFWGAFHQSRAGIDMLRWAGVPEKKAILYGGLLGVALQTPIEIFDGYQADYGASLGDIVANTVGSAAVVGQELAWQEVRIMPKYSFHTTRYAGMRPNVLGSSLGEQALKDYNGQTYWLSVDVGAFLKEESRYPRWLTIAVGYGAQEMVFNDPEANAAAGLDAHRQYYLSPDLNLMHFKGRSKVWNTALYVLSIIKIPAPTLEYNRKDGLKLHPLYF
jgi:VanZ family protein